jgi:hypothetical protein
MIDAEKLEDVAEAADATTDAEKIPTGEEEPEITEKSEAVAEPEQEAEPEPEKLIWDMEDIVEEPESAADLAAEHLAAVVASVKEAANRETAEEPIVEPTETLEGLPLEQEQEQPQGAPQDDSENPVVAEMMVYINDKPVYLTGKKEYIFVNIFDYYEFDLDVSGGRSVVTKLNGQSAPFTAVLQSGDKIELGWES